MSAMRHAMTDNLNPVTENTSRPTWLVNAPVPEVVETFVGRLYQYEHYEGIARCAEALLQAGLEEEGVTQFKLACRAKNEKNLKEKLVMRYETKQYRNEDDIKRDIVDLAGVRIILYMPTRESYGKVTRTIQKIWGHEVKPKNHPVANRDTIEATLDDDKPRTKYRPRHLGYRAIHYRAPMKEDQVDKLYRRFMPDDVVEIQVVSALTHAWAEVGHDIVYKSYMYGPPTLQEERTLDSLNGLVQSGELLLEQFQDMVHKRTYALFKHRAELTIFLRDFRETELESNGLDFSEDTGDLTTPRSEGVYILFKFLEKRKKHYPIALRNALKELQYPHDFLRTIELMTKEFKGRPRLAKDMAMVVCLIRHLLYEDEYKVPATSFRPREKCTLMMSTLTILQYCLGGAEHATEFLQKAKLSPAQVDSINFLLDDSRRFHLLSGSDPAEVEGMLTAAWLWFREEARQPKSLYGLLFRLAEEGCRKELDVDTQLRQLEIGPISRSSTASNEEYFLSAVDQLQFGSMNSSSALPRMGTDQSFDYPFPTLERIVPPSNSHRPN